MVFLSLIRCNAHAFNAYGIDTLQMRSFDVRFWRLRVLSRRTWFATSALKQSPLLRCREGGSGRRSRTAATDSNHAAIERRLACRLGVCIERVGDSQRVDGLTCQAQDVRQPDTFGFVQSQAPVGSRANHQTRDAKGRGSAGGIGDHSDDVFVARSERGG